MTKKDLVRKELHTLQIERFRFQHLKTRLDKVRGHIVHGSDNSFGFDIQHDIQALTQKKTCLCIYSCVLKELHDIRKEIEGVLLRSNAAYDARFGFEKPAECCYQCQ